MIKHLKLFCVIFIQFQFNSKQVLETYTQTRIKSIKKMFKYVTHIRSSRTKKNEFNQFSSVINKNIDVFMTKVCLCLFIFKSGLFICFLCV